MSTPMDVNFTVPGRAIPSDGEPGGSEDIQRAMALVIAVGGLDHLMVAWRIEGEPIAKARARVNRHRHYTPQRTLDAEEDVARSVLQHAADHDGLQGNVAVAMVFYRSNRHRIDTDNLIKTVLDGITKSRAVWTDDSHVTAIVGVLEMDREWPRIAVAIAPHVSTLLRGTDALTSTCETCGTRFRGHGSKPARYCSVPCRTLKKQGLLTCMDCGGAVSTQHSKRCHSCYMKWLVVHRYGEKRPG